MMTLCDTLPDIKRVDPATLTTTAECDAIMTDLDKVIGNIADQLAWARGMAAAQGQFANMHWYRAAQRALKGAKTTRQAVQTRRGVLSREERVRRVIAIERTFERAFVDAARRVLTADQFREIAYEARRAQEADAA